MTWNRRPAPSNWKSLRLSVLVAHAGVCHVCHHGGSDQVDHLVNVARGGTHRSENLRPIHGRPCPTCNRRCHQHKTTIESQIGRGTYGRKREAESHPGDLW